MKYNKLFKKYENLQKFYEKSNKKLKIEINFLINKLNDSEVIIKEREKVSFI